MFQHHEDHEQVHGHDTAVDGQNHLQQCLRAFPIQKQTFYYVTMFLPTQMQITHTYK